MERMRAIMAEMSKTTHSLVGDSRELQATTDEMRDHLADFDDQYRPLRNYFYWDKHCFDIPMCTSMRSLFDSMDGIDKMSESMQAMVRDLEHTDQLMPQMVEQLPPMINITKDIRNTILSMYSTFNGLISQIDRMTDTSTVLGQVFDAAKNDDFFYLRRRPLRTRISSVD